MPNLTQEVRVFNYAEQCLLTVRRLSLTINTRHYPRREYYTTPIVNADADTDADAGCGQDLKDQSFLSPQTMFVVCVVAKATFV